MNIPRERARVRGDDARPRSGWSRLTTAGPITIMTVRLGGLPRRSVEHCSPGCIFSPSGFTTVHLAEQRDRGAAPHFWIDLGADRTGLSRDIEDLQQALLVGGVHRFAAGPEVHAAPRHLEERGPLRCLHGAVRLSNFLARQRFDEARARLGRGPGCRRVLLGPLDAKARAERVPLHLRGADRRDERPEVLDAAASRLGPSSGGRTSRVVMGSLVPTTARYGDETVAVCATVQSDRSDLNHLSTRNA